MILRVVPRNNTFCMVRMSTRDVTVAYLKHDFSWRALSMGSNQTGFDIDMLSSIRMPGSCRIKSRFRRQGPNSRRTIKRSRLFRSEFGASLVCTVEGSLMLGVIMSGTAAWIVLAGASRMTRRLAILPNFSLVPRRVERAHQGSCC